jgi:hypothetical protein
LIEVGDAASYTLNDVILVPFVGSQRDDPTQDAFNFFLSQLRIRIEMLLCSRCWKRQVQR